MVVVGEGPSSADGPFTFAGQLQQAPLGHGRDRFRHLSSWTAVFVLALLVGFGSAKTQQARETAAGAMTPALAAETEARGVATAAPGVPTEIAGGVLTGHVGLAGEEIPQPTRVRNTTEVEVCGMDHTLEDMLIDPKNRGIANVIVALNGVPEERIPPIRDDRLVLDNTNCRFVPHASVLTVRGTIETTNSDPILHTTHLYGPLEANIALPARGPGISRTVKKPGMIIVKCDVHSWMQAFVRVDAHPFHAVTDSSGSFRIADIPPGRYALEIWHERLGSQQQAVHIESGKTEHLEITYAVARIDALVP